MKTIAPCLLSLMVVLAPFTSARAGLPVGVLGDSYSDEYQFYPPDRSTALNWVEILASARKFDFGQFAESSRGEPRNQGYAYNWARSDATTVDMIATGQHTGLAVQVARGEVKLVVIFIGGNDFINAMKSADPVGTLGEVLPRALANYRLAVQTILDASPEVRILVATLPDIRHLPEFAGPIREGRIPRATVDAFSAAMRRYNAQIRSIAHSDPRFAIADLDLTTRASDLLSPETVAVGGQTLDRRGGGNDLDHFFLGDVRHPGTLGQGMMARMFVDAINARFGLGIEPLDDPELLALARSVSVPAPAPVDASINLASLSGDPRPATDLGSVSPVRPDARPSAPAPVAPRR